jgi:curli biogenesis system outer membrane secretion channel CsgG
MDRQNMKSNMQEAKFMGAKQNIKGAHYVVIHFCDSMWSF